MRVSKWGDSLAVRLPKALVEELDLRAGDEVDLEKVRPGVIGIRRREQKDEFIRRVMALARPAPEGADWSRDEANER
jgi:antitoxin MazE